MENIERQTDILLNGYYGELKSGDIIENSNGLRREILTVYKKSYEWCDPELPKDESNKFISRWNNDPKFEIGGWRIMTQTEKWKK